MKLASRNRMGWMILILTTILTASPAVAGESNSVDTRWRSTAMTRLASQEYEVHPVGSLARGESPADRGILFEAPNRAQGFRTRFGEDRVELSPRLAGRHPWGWSLALSAIGRPGSMAGAGKARIGGEGARVEYRRTGVLEWFENAPRGLEHGLLLRNRPEGGESPLWIEIATRGSLHSRFAADGQAVEAVDAHGHPVLRYAQLNVTDARGDRLAARMEGFTRAGEGGIRLVIDDRQARYPLSVDPLATSASWDAAGEQDDALFGWSVLTAGDVNGDGYSDVIVGAPGFDNTYTDEGAAFVYLGSPSGLAFDPATRLYGGQPGAHFGHAVGTAGDVDGDGYSDVIVGAYGAGHEGREEGAVYVFLGSAAGLEERAHWTREGDQEGARFGCAAATAGDVNGDGYSDVIVGADRYSNHGETAGGAAFVYLGSSHGLETEPVWSGGCDQDSCAYGASVATAGDVDGDGDDEIIVGAHQHSEGEEHDGRAMVYLGDHSGPQAAASWIIDGDQMEGHLGISVATAGDVNGDGYADVIVGADRQTLANTEDGIAYVYYGSPGGLETTPQPSLSSRQGGAHFGHSVASAGDVDGDGYADVTVGAEDGEHGESGEGLVYLFYGGPGTFDHTADWTGEGDRPGAHYGHSVGPAGDVNGDGFSDLVVGAPYEDMKAVRDGGCFAYHGSAGALEDASSWERPGGHSNERLGSALSRAGDVNGDGYADFIVGAGGSGSTRGRAYLFHGGPEGPSTSPDWSVLGEPSERLGEGVSQAGDVNGDGYDDVLVASEWYENGQTEEGAVYLYLGSPTGLETNYDWMVESNQEHGTMTSLAGGGDVNGDGYADVLLTCERCSNGSGASLGQVWLYYGSADGLPATPDWTVANPGNSGTWTSFGQSVDDAGDINGDGYDDIIIGSPYEDAGGKANCGKIFLFYGGPSGPAATADWTWNAPHSSAKAGTAAAITGDVNGDGYADLLIGAGGNTPDEIGAGQAYLFYGSASGPGSSPDWTLTGDATTYGIGDSVAAAGDINGDGYADVAIGEDLHDGAETEIGRVGLFLGSAAGLPAHADWLVEGDRQGAKLGESLDSAGDVNGDGYADLLIGAQWWDDLYIREGKIYLYGGNEGFGVALRPRQRRTDGDPLPHLGFSDSLDAARFDVVGRLPAGAVTVRLAVEVEPYGTDFDGAGVEHSGFVSGAPGGALAGHTVTGLTGGPRYHWRMRVESRPSSAPFQWWSRWLTTPWNGSTDPDFREVADGDGDGYADSVDCAPRDENVWAAPSDVRNLTVRNETKGLEWDEPEQPGCTTPLYDVIKNRHGPRPMDWSKDAECVASNITERVADDPEVPGPEHALYYLVRVENPCGSNLGTDSAGTPRDAIECP